ncbi:MAG TPA: prolipoprotein diacylglyceryl transferase [Chromatiales bacterium]|nr:prolipoprotein diacylglyceryl transferase [Chromatiales bacterium]
MLKLPDIDPVIVHLGPLAVRWYGLMYLLGFAAAWWLGRRRARADAGWDLRQVDDLIFFGVIGVVFGGRIGYVLFYAFSSFLENPLMVFRVWEGGMSFHGGLIGVLLAMVWFAHRHKKAFFEVTDFLAPLVPIGLGAGRIANFINGELWGKTTTLPWGISLPCPRFPEYCGGVASGWSVPVHPSQLYEALLEGLALFLVLWLFSARSRPRMAVSGLFLLVYGVFRFLIEFVRLPDAQLGYLAFGWVTMGQILSLPMILFGALLLVLAYRKREVGSASVS